jgi:hypothetical protein
LNSTTLDSTIFVFNNPGFNNTWIQRFWIHQPLVSTSIGLNNPDFNNT